LKILWRRINLSSEVYFGVAQYGSKYGERNRTTILLASSLKNQNSKGKIQKEAIQN